MTRSLKGYLGGFEQKTLFIYCNDCYAANQIASNPNLAVHTLFGNMFSASNPFEVGMFEHHVKFERVTNIIISGHYGCEILKYINDSCTENLRLNANQIELYMKLEFQDINGEKALMRQVIKQNLLEQVNKLSRLSFIKRKLAKGEISIKGIIIDDMLKDGSHSIEIVI